MPIQCEDMPTSHTYRLTRQQGKATTSHSAGFRAKRSQWTMSQVATCALTSPYQVAT
ncbi:MAG TPA: hypothetical protein VNQ76_10365 [Planctomicrobium sp.]|nr:hypothetical protein [Planctomicrobium sp.]